MPLASIGVENAELVRRQKVTPLLISKADDASQLAAHERPTVDRGGAYFFRGSPARGEWTSLLPREIERYRE